jgi:excisionase family DNA binding protein
MSELLTVREVAEILHLHETTIRRYIHDGKLASVRIGRNVRVPRAALDEFLSSQAEQAEPAVGEEDAFREPAVAYRTAVSSRPVAPRPALVARVADDLSHLDESDLNQVFEFIADLKARREEREREKLFAQILAEARQLAQERADWPREKVWEHFEKAMESARQQMIENGTAFEGDWIGD